jgi:hypothetical protein
MPSLTRKLKHRLKVKVGGYLQQGLEWLASSHQGPMARLYSVDALTVRTDCDFTVVQPAIPTLAIAPPQWFTAGPIEQEYFKALQACADVRATEAAGVISATNVDVCFPVSLHHWQGKIFAEALLKPALLNNPKYAFYSESIPFRSKRSYGAEAILLSMPWHHNYFVWLLEILPRLQLCEACAALQNLPLIVPQTSPRFVRETLAAIGYSKRTEFVPNGVVRFQQLHLLTKLAPHRSPSPLAVQWLRSKLLNSSNRGGEPRRLYVSRQDALSRQVANEAEVETALAEYGFETVCMADYSFREQIQLFQSAELIVGSHGAAFANLAFATRSGVLIEFFELGHCSYSFYWLANLRGWQYGFLVGQPQKLGFHVEIRQLQKVVEQAIAHSTQTSQTRF